MRYMVTTLEDKSSAGTSVASVVVVDVPRSAQQRSKTPGAEIKQGAGNDAGRPAFRSVMPYGVVRTCRMLHGD